MNAICHHGHVAGRRWSKPSLIKRLVAACIVHDAKCKVSYGAGQWHYFFETKSEWTAKYLYEQVLGRVWTEPTQTGPDGMIVKPPVDHLAKALENNFG